MNYNNVNAEDIVIEDIFLSISRLNRFVGHSTRPYTVAEHTLMGLKVCKILGYTTKQQFQYFTHDFAEAYVGDCPSPLKKLLPKFSEIENMVDNAINKRIGIDNPTEEEKILTKRVDLTMLVLEMRDLTHHDYKSFIDDMTYTSILENSDINLLVSNWDNEAELRDMLLINFIELQYKYKNGLE